MIMFLYFFFILMTTTIFATMQIVMNGYNDYVIVTRSQLNQLINMSLVNNFLF